MVIHAETSFHGGIGTLGRTFVSRCSKSQKASNIDLKVEQSGVQVDDGWQP